jgi:EpsI family protein
MLRLDRRSLAMLVLLLAAQGGAWVTRPLAGPTYALQIGTIPLRLPDWRGRDLGRFDAVTLDMLKPDAYLNREYVAADGFPAYLAVIYGHRKNSFHSPGFCLLGGGWNIVSKSRVEFRARGGDPVLANRFVLARQDQQAVVIYYYITANHRANPSWVMHQAYLVGDRLARGQAVGALVRLTVPVATDAESATGRGLSLLSAVHPSLERVLHPAARD